MDTETLKTIDDLKQYLATNIEALEGHVSLTRDIAKIAMSMGDIIFLPENLGEPMDTQSVIQETKNEIGRRKELLALLDTKEMKALEPYDAIATILALLSHATVSTLMN